MVKELTARELVFCEAILAGKPAIKADIEAGYSARVAGTEGPKRLRKPHIQEYINSKKRRIEQKGEQLQDRILAELEKLAFANMGDFISIDEHGQPHVDLRGATRDQLAALTKASTRKRTIYNTKGERVGEEETSQVQLVDKHRGLELLGRHLQMFQPKEQHIVVDVADRLLDARQRLLSSGEQSYVDAECEVVNTGETE